MLTQSLHLLSPYLSSQPDSCWHGEMVAFDIPHLTPGMLANRHYFGHPEWGRNYLNACHRDRLFQERWQAAIGSWQGKIVVDIGCGAGNLYASLQERCGIPKLLIGVDISRGALLMAQELGYAPLLADAQHLPLISGFADIVTLNAALHHCDDMEAMLHQAARLVRPGGLLVSDHDPQKSAWGNLTIANLIWNARLPLYRLLQRGGHATAEEQRWSTATEIHHRPGDGVTPDFFRRTLEPLGFTVHLYPHNRTAGAEVLQGKPGRAAWLYRTAQRLSGSDPNHGENALLLMCVAQRTG